MDTNNEALEFLKRELERRCYKNPHYSLRSFANSLGVDPSLLSKILNGKKSISLKMAESIFPKLNLQPRERKTFFLSLVQKKLKQKNNPKILNFIDPTTEFKAIKLDHEIFKVLGDWSAIAILEMSFLKEFKGSIEEVSQFVSKKLDISIIKSKLMLEKLLRFNLLEKMNQRYVKKDPVIQTKNPLITSSYLKNLQRQFFDKAIEAMDKFDMIDREQISYTMAIDPDQLNEAKEKIRAFIKEMSETLETSQQKRVYNLMVSLYPLDSNQMPRSYLDGASI